MILSITSHATFMYVIGEPEYISQPLQSLKYFIFLEGLVAGLGHLFMDLRLSTVRKTSK